jgi:hypothetical protein
MTLPDKHTRIKPAIGRIINAVSGSRIFINVPGFGPPAGGLEASGGEVNTTGRLGVLVSASTEAFTENVTLSASFTSTSVLGSASSLRPPGAGLDTLAV